MGVLQNANSGGFLVCFSQKTCTFSKKNHPKGYRRRPFATSPFADKRRGEFPYPDSRPQPGGLTDTGTLLRSILQKKYSVETMLFLKASHYKIPGSNRRTAGSNISQMLDSRVWNNDLHVFCEIFLHARSIAYLQSIFGQYVADFVKLAGVCICLF